VPKAAISHDHPVRFKKFLSDYLNSFQAKTVSNSNVKRGHCVWVMDAKSYFWQKWRLTGTCAFSESGFWICFN
jgi:hypothetical protein